MIYIILFIAGLALGSFVNALVWRLRQQLDNNGDPKKLISKEKSDLSISKGRSMCPDCKHTLGAKDLVPVFSWLLLKGKCRYCKKSISVQYPLVELLVAGLFVLSYFVWPANLDTAWQVILFVNWLIAVVGLVALAIYDIKWMILPDRILKVLAVVTIIATILTFVLGRPIYDFANILVSVAIGGGIFYVLHQVSKGKWIGGGDVKLGLYLGLLLANPKLAFLYIFVASILGTLYALPLLSIKKASKNAHIPFGPFLIAGAMITMLWGRQIIDWYINTLS